MKDTIRFCLSCNNITIWKYNKAIGHSRCSECGSWFSTNATEEDKKFAKAQRELEIEKRKSKYERLIKKLKEQKKLKKKEEMKKGMLPSQKKKYGLY